MKIALIAHDKRKRNYSISLHLQRYLSDYELFATGTTGKMIQEEIGLDVHRFQSGPLGGDQQIGAKIAANDLDLVVFFRDPLTAQPHEPDVTALLRLCDVYRIPLATNEASAEIMIRGIQSGWLDWRNVKESTSLYDE